MESHPIVSRREWLAARIALLEHEKALTRHRDQISAERLALPWVRVEKEYLFDGPEGKLTLSDLFRGNSQLYIKHFMMAPGAHHQCVGCSLEVDHVAGILPHLENHDVSYAVVARAPIEEIEVVRKRMDWKFLWVSSFRTDFNYDFNVSFKPEDVTAGRAQYNFRSAPEWAANIQDLSGRSVFYKNEAGEIFHTYSAYGRGGEEALGILRHLRRNAERSQRDGSLSFSRRLGAAAQHVRERRRGRSQRPLPRAVVRLPGACRSSSLTAQAMAMTTSEQATMAESSRQKAARRGGLAMDAGTRGAYSQAVLQGAFICAKASSPKVAAVLPSFHALLQGRLLPIAAAEHPAP